MGTQLGGGGLEWEGTGLAPVRLVPAIHGGHLARQHPRSGYLRKEHIGRRYMDGSLSIPGSLSFITAEQRCQVGT